MNESVSSHVIEDDNLSRAWADAYLKVADSPKNRIETLVVRVNLGTASDLEDSDVRQILDDALMECGDSSCETVAGTIFPQSLWNPQATRKALFGRYATCWPRIQKCPPNKNGTYFQRMTVFDDANPVNQLETILDEWGSGLRRNSAFQLSIFDPRRDHKFTPYLGFPCLHQVSFTPLGPNGKDGLSVTGYYATQHLFTKAYGNYLGLYRLGQFVAHEMGLRLSSVSCIAAVAAICNKDSEKSAVLKPLKLRLKSYLARKKLGKN